EAKHTTEQTSRHLDRSKTRADMTTGPLQWKSQQKADGQHSEDTPKSKNDDVEKSFERRSNSREDEQHQSRASSRTVNHTDQQRPREVLMRMLVAMASERSSPCFDEDSHTQPD